MDPETREVEGPGGIPSLSLPLVLFLGVYGFIAFGLYMAAQGDSSLLLASVLLLPVLLAALVLGGAFAKYTAHRRFYLAIAIVPIFTLISLTLIGTLPSLTQSLVSYLLLGIALIVFQQATQARIQPEGVRATMVLISVPFAIPLGLGVALVSVLLFSISPAYPPDEASIAVLVLAAVGFVDEYWFRGILQSQIGTVTQRWVGWLAAAGLFVAFAAPMGDLLTLAFRAWLGLLLGFLVWWRHLLPLALMIRVASAIFLVVLGSFPMVI